MVDRLLPTYTALCILSLFVDLVYKVGGTALRPFDAMVGLGLFLIVAAACVRGKIRPLNKVGIFYVFILLYTYRFLNGLLLSGVGVAVKEFVQAIEFVGLIYMVGMATSTVSGREKFLKWLFWGFGVIASFAAVWHISQGELVNYKQLGASKLSFSLFALFAIPAYLRKRSFSLAMVMGLAILLTLLSGERKGWVALAAAGGAVFYVMRGMRIGAVLKTVFQPKYVAMAGTSVLIIAAVASQIEYVSKQFQSIRDVFLLLSEVDLRQANVDIETTGSNVARLYLLLASMRMLLENPLFGVGTERFKTELAQGFTENGVVQGAHSEYQLLAAENGVIGLVLYSTIWFVAIRKAAYLTRVAPVGRYYPRAAILAFTVFGAVINLFLGGGALNIVFMAVAVGLLVGFRNERVTKMPHSSTLTAV